MIFKISYYFEKKINIKTTQLHNYASLDDMSPVLVWLYFLSTFFGSFSAFHSSFKVAYRQIIFQNGRIGFKNSITNVHNLYLYMLYVHKCESRVLTDVKILRPYGSSVLEMTTDILNCRNHNPVHY